MKTVMQNKRPGAAKRKAFTVIEMLLAVAVVGILFGLIFAFYKSAINKSKYVEAVATVDTISKAEEIKQMNSGEYVAAANTQEVNEKLGLDIKPRWYNYKVIGVTDDNFIVLAEKILDDIDNGNLSSEPIVIAKDRSGPVSPESIGPSGTVPPPSVEEPSPGPSTPGGGGPGGGGPGGGSPGGGSPTGPTTPPTGGNNQTGGGGGGVLYPTLSGASPDIVNLLNNAIGWGQYADTLIQNNAIKVVYANFADFGMTDSTNGFWWGTTDHTETIDGRPTFVQGNTIFLNEHLSAEGWTNNAIASIIGHEATHADYTYHPDQYIAATMAANPFPPGISDPFGTPLRPITLSDIHIPGNSIDQEYNAFKNDVDVWNKIKGTDTNAELDAEALVLAEPVPFGEADLKAAIRSTTGYKNLPEF